MSMKVAYSGKSAFPFRRLPGVSPRYCLQKLLKCCAEEKLNSSIMSESGTYGSDKRYLMCSARF